MAQESIKGEPCPFLSNSSAPLNPFLDFAMDISQYVPPSAAYQALSSFQIDKFFNTHQSVSRKDCDGYATTIAGGAIRPTAIQGGPVTP